MKPDYDKMEKNALTVFLSFASFIFAFSLWYSYSNGHALAGNLVLGAMVFITGLVIYTRKSKT